MAQLTSMQLAKWEKAFAGAGIFYETDAEYEEAIVNLVGYFDVLIQMGLQQNVSKK